MDFNAEALRALLQAQNRINAATDLTEKLTAVADGVVATGIFRRALIQVYGTAPLGHLIGGAGLTADEIQWVAAHGHGPKYYRDLTARGQELAPGAFFISHTAVSADEMAAMLASHHEAGDFTEWHPDDMFLVLLDSTTADSVGNLTCDDPTNGKVPGAAEAEVIRLFASEAANLLQMELLRRSDGLTGLGNDLWVAEAFARLDKTGAPFSLMYLLIKDLDNVHQRLGRRFRDEVVKSMGRILRQAVPREAWCARLHGDEFVVVVDDPEPARTEYIRQHLVRELSRWNDVERLAALSAAGLHESLMHDPMSAIQLSVGSASRWDKDSAHDVLARAEKAARKPPTNGP
ncbi:MAG: diguanylate cyclase domain-containing protein [Sulfobacillus sp.]